VDKVGEILVVEQ